MSWRKYFTPVDTSGKLSPVSGGSVSKANPSRTNYSSYLPDVYAGHPNRLERYGQYDTMDTDSEVNAALDILAEFCTQENAENGTPFQIFFKEQATASEIKIIKKYMQQWTKLNQFNKRIFKVVRNAFKYGDVFFVRDPETQTWMYVDPAKVDKIIVNESDGKKPEQYHVRDFNPNFEALSTTAINPSNLQGGSSTFGGAYGSGSGGAGGSRGMVGSYPTGASSSRFTTNQNQYAIDARHVIHISMSEGLDNNYPFGNSLLESIFKVFKQKELLEDAIIIYRVQRAPERRVFYIDVGNMPSHLAMSFVERVKNEVNQRRIPSTTGGGQTVVDSAFNPLSTNEDYFFPQTCLSLTQPIKLLDGRDLPLSDIIAEFQAGRVNWTYTVNQSTGEIEPGKIVWAGKTRLDAQVVQVMLDNGETVKVTPDHRFIMRDGSEVEAQHLQAGDSLMPLYLHEGSCGKVYNEFALMRECNTTDGEKFVQSVTWLQETEDTGDITIESASDSHNFALTAGVFIHNSEGRGSKVEILPGGCFSMDTLVPLLDGRIKTIAELADEYRDGKVNWTYSTNPETGRVVPGVISWAGVTQKSAKVMKLVLDNGKHIVCTPDHKFPILGKGLIQARDLTLGESFITLAVKTNQVYQHDTGTWESVQNMVGSELLEYSVTENTTSGNQYSNYYECRKLVKTEYLDPPMEVGTLTIDQDEKFHNYHNFALAVGIFAQNSNLGEIDDLKFFTNKMFRALRIPSSYLPTSSDDGGSNFNDGRVGTAYIQELRFNKYCERLQTLMNSVFDSEFKLYLHTKGINIDSNIFDVKFNPPQNFAAYRQAEMDTARVGTFSTMVAVPFVSKRFAMKRFLGMTAEEIAENEVMWREENIDTDQSLSASAELRSVGVSANTISGDLNSLAMAPSMPAPEDMSNAEAGAAGAAGPTPPAGNAPPGSAPT